MKLLKKIATLVAALTLCLGASASIAACNGIALGSSASSSSISSTVSSSVESSSSASSVEESSSAQASSVESSVEESASVESGATEPATVYTFIVLNSDGTPAANVNVQLCVLGNSAACFMPMATDANGRVEYTFTGFPGEGEYEIHLLDAMYSPIEFTGPASTPATYAVITLTLK